MKNHCYITTAIPYVNAQPHVGFASELVLADFLARSNKRKGCEVRFQTGTDENALKNVEAAHAAGKSPQAWVDAKADEFRTVAESLQIDFDRFLRTTESAHASAVKAFWQTLRPDDIYKAPYRALYCGGCEDFLFEKDLVEGVCPDHGKAPELVEESNYFFQLTSYQSAIEEWLTSGRVRILPEKRRNEILSFVRGGLRDISISRPASRAKGWGIPVPEDPSQVVYVWIDALVNYIAGVGYPDSTDFQGWWNPNVKKLHVIGRNVWKFHAIYWPALLLSAGLPLPDELVVHGFLTAEGRKISKSLGNAPSPDPLIARFGSDAVRYYLLRLGNPFDDGDFSERTFAVVYESDLVNGLGNLVSRILSLAIKSGIEQVNRDQPPSIDRKFEEACANCRPDEALAILWKRIATINRSIEESKPWELLRNGSLTEAAAIVTPWLIQLKTLASDLEPFLPGTAARITKTLTQKPLRATPLLFPRLSPPGGPSV